MAICLLATSCNHKPDNNPNVDLETERCDTFAALNPNTLIQHYDVICHLGTDTTKKYFSGDDYNILDSTLIKNKHIEILIKNDTVYSKQYISQLAKSAYKKKIFLIDSMVVTEDTSYFPTTLILNKQYNFTLKDEPVSLQIKRVNFSTIHYSLTGANSFIEEDDADIKPLFFVTGETRYISRSKDISIEITPHSTSNSKLAATFLHYQKGTGNLDYSKTFFQTK